MAESIANWFVDVFGGKVSPEVLVFIVSLLPVLELRGGLIAAGLLNIPILKAFVICFIGNMLPIPFILLFIRKVFRKLKNAKPLQGLVNIIEKKVRRSSEKVIKYQLWGLLLLVAIPIPGTGAWTGAFVAVLMDIRMKKSLPVISLGVIIAGIIVSALMYGVVGNIIS